MRSLACPAIGKEPPDLQNAMDWVEGIYSKFVSFTIEVAINHFEWETYDTLEVPAGESLTHNFSRGYQAHWVRLTTNAATQATATFTYK